MTSLNGRVALVTGASSGIGEAVALALAEAGAAVALVARRGDRLDALARRIAAAGGRAIGITGDLADADFAESTVAAAVSHFGRLDILVNAAGIMPEAGVAEGDLAKWRQVIDLNLMACLYTSKAAVAAMRGQGSGDIVNVSSTSGRRASGLFGAYSTSKFGLNAMSEGLRQEVGALGIRVCTLEPGATNTALWENISGEELRKSVQQRAERPDAMTAQDIAAAVLFVVSLPPRVNVSELLIRPTTDVAPL